MREVHLTLPITKHRKDKHDIDLNEEAAILEEPSASKRAYRKIEYTIGCKE